MAAEALLSQAFLATRDAELALRQAVRIDLNRSLGPLWYSMIPATLRDDWTQLERSSMVLAGPERHAEMLDFATLGDIGGITNRFWGIFEARFGRNDEFQAHLNDFRIMRNALMHSTDLPEKDCKHLISVATELRNQSLAEIRAPSIQSDTPPPAASPSQRPRPTPGLNPAQVSLLRIVQQATAMMSGTLLGERDALVAYLDANRSGNSPEAIAYIKEKFAVLSGTPTVVDRLLGEIAPARPETPNGGWATKKWLNWAGRSYLPYRKWMIQHGEADAKIDDMALEYEDWLRQHYPELLHSSNGALVITMYRTIKEQLDKSMRVLWLVIDNLCGLWAADFIGLLSEAGVRVQESRPMFALLPSTTAISRRALLSGRMPSEATHFADDESACRQLWLEQGVSDIAFCTSIKDAELAATLETRLIVLIDNRLDTLAHQPEEPGFDRSEEMLLKMTSLATKLSALLRQMNAVAPTRLVIGTDHGATYPGVNSQTIAVPPSAIFDQDAERHQRYTIVRDLSGLNNIDWHVLDAEQFGLPWNCAAARGQRFIGKRLRAFTHGGLSPEETVVKLLIAEIGEREPLKLVLSQASPPVRLGRSEQLAILVRNPFNILVEDLELALPTLNIRFELMDVPARSEAITSSQVIVLPAKAEVQDEAISIFVTGHFQIAGRSGLMEQYLRVKVRELYRSSVDDFGDLLNG